MGQIIGGAAKPKRCNINQLSQLGTPAAGEYILVSSDNSMNAAGQGNFDCYIEGDGQKAATELELKPIANGEISSSSNGAVSGKTLYDDLKETVEIKNIATFANGGYIKQDGTVGNYGGFYYVDHLDISEYSKLTIYCRASSSAWNVLFDADDNILYRWQQNTSPYLFTLDLTQYPTAKYLSLSNYNLSGPYVDALKDDNVPTKTKLANLQNQIDEASVQISSLKSQGKRYGYNFDFVPDQTGGYFNADGSFVSNSYGHYCQDVDIEGYTLISIKCTTGSYYCVLKDVNNNVLAAKKSVSDAVVFDIANDYPSAKYLCACSTTTLCVSGYFMSGDLNKSLFNIPSDWWLQQQRFTPSIINGYFNRSRLLVGIGSYSQYHFLLAVDEGYVINYAGYGSGNSANYIFYDENFIIVPNTTVYGQDYRSGINITVPAGVAFVEFFSVNPSGSDNPLHISSDDLPDLNNSSSAGSSVGNVLYGKSYVCGGDSTSAANVVREEGATEGDSYTLIPYGEVIARRNNMLFANKAGSGGDIYITGAGLKSVINANTDYLTCMFGGNESGRISEHPIGEVDSSDTNTFYGAYNDLIRYCLTTNPKIKILLITPIFDYTHGEIMQAVINVAKRWGCGYLNTYSDPHVPLTYQTEKSSELGLCAEAKTLREAAINVGTGDVHPTQAGADAFSTIVEAYMRAL